MAGNKSGKGRWLKAGFAFGSSDYIAPLPHFPKGRCARRAPHLLGVEKTIARAIQNQISISVNGLVSLENQGRAPVCFPPPLEPAGGLGGHHHSPGEHSWFPCPPVQGTPECLRWRQSLKWTPSNLLPPHEIITNPVGMDNYLS